MEQQQKTTTIIPEKIWEKEVDIKGSPAKKTFIKYKNFIFSCFGSLPKGIEKGKKCQIEYDYNSKYVKEDEEGRIVFYNLIKPKIRMSDIMNKLEEIEKKIDELKEKQNPPIQYPKYYSEDTSTNTSILSPNTSSDNSTFSPEDLKEEDIPTVEDEDTL